MNRRDFLLTSVTAATAAALPALSEADPVNTQAKGKAPSSLPVVAMLVYPEFTVLDLMGPYQFLSALMGYKVILVSKKKGLIKADTGLTIQTDASFADCPKKVAALFIPGGTAGTANAMTDSETIAFVQSRAKDAKVISSVCTGSFILAAAGLLKGKRATGHWLARDLLKDFGAIPIDERVVKDGNVVTGAGVSAGLDLALELIAELSDDHYAKLCQLWFEYDPHPKFDCGSPSKSTPADVEMLKTMVPTFRKTLKSIAEKKHA